MSDLVGNPEYRFSRVGAQIINDFKPVFNTCIYPILSIYYNILAIMFNKLFYVILTNPCFRLILKNKLALTKIITFYKVCQPRQCHKINGGGIY